VSTGGSGEGGEGGAPVDTDVLAGARKAIEDTVTQRMSELQLPRTRDGILAGALGVSEEDMPKGDVENDGDGSGQGGAAGTVGARSAPAAPCVAQEQLPLFFVPGLQLVMPVQARPTCFWQLTLACFPACAGASIHTGTTCVYRPESPLQTCSRPRKDAVANMTKAETATDSVQLNVSVSS
jgi:hypothetical protein